jgi:UDP-glucose 4-epimerase
MINAPPLNILIIGGTGYIGSHLADSLAAKHSITVAGRRLPASQASNIKWIQLDVTQPIPDYLLQHRSIIIDLAGEPPAQAESSPEQSYQTTVDGTRNLLTASRKVCPNCRFIYIASRYTYGIPTNLPVHENHPQIPISKYGRHQHQKLQLIYNFTRQYAIETLTFIVSSVYGSKRPFPRSPHNILNYFIHQALRRQPLILYDHGRQLRDYLFIDDLISAFHAAIDRPPAPGTLLNLGGSEITSLKQASRLIIDAIGSGQIIHQDWPRDQQSFKTGDFYFDTLKAQSLLQWRPATRLKSGIMKTVNLLKRHYE